MILKIVVVFIALFGSISIDLPAFPENKAIYFKASTTVDGKKSSLTLRLFPENKHNIRMELEIRDKTRGTEIVTNLRYKDQQAAIKCSKMKKPVPAYALNNYDGFEVLVAQDYRFAQFKAPEHADLKFKQPLLLKKSNNGY